MRAKWMTVLATFVTAAAVGAIPASGAWAAEPEFEMTKGTFPAELSSTGNVNGFSFESSENGSGLTCKTSAVLGEVRGPKSVHGYEGYSGCKGTFAGLSGECSNGTYGIITKTLQGTIGYVNKGTEPVGLELEGEEKVKSGEEPIFAEFTCTWLGVHFKTQLKGHLIGQIRPELGVEFENLSAVYGGNKGKQEYTGFEGGPTGQQLKWVIGGSGGETFNVSVNMENRFTVAPDRMEIR